MNNHKKNSQLWIKNTLKITLVILSIVIVVNYINDPLWVFNHQNFSNKTQLGFNERQQKTNRIYFDDKNYDSILLGNSKVTYINQNNFKKGRLFNYAVSAMNIDEYDGYIDFFKEVTKKAPKYILLGIDFNSCLKNTKIHSYQAPEFYINNSKSALYKFKHLLSYSTFMHSIRNLTKFLDKKKAIYNNENVKIKVGFKKQHPENYEPNLEKIIKNIKVTYPDAIYNKKLIESFKKIKNNNQASKIIAIFLPDLFPYFTINKNRNIYERCLSDATQIFGAKNIFNFMKMDKVTANVNNYYDGSHFRDYIGDLILQKISENL